MKKITTILLVLIIGFVAMYILKELGCNETPKEIKDNTELLDRLKPLEVELAVLRAKNDSLELSYQNKKNVKDSVVIRYETKYIPYYDTMTNDTALCLPKKYVDTLVLSYENIINEADTLIKVKSLTIDNLTAQNEIKDTLINNYQDNELVYKKEIKKQKRKKWLFFGGGVGVGYLIGKLF